MGKKNRPKNKRTGKPPSKSKYEEKYQQIKDGIRQPGWSSDEETRKFQGKTPEEKPYDFRTGAIATEYGINVGISFLPDPIAIRLTPYLANGTRMGMLLREERRGGTYSIREGKKGDNWPPEIHKETAFERFYNNTTITQKEGLMAIEAALKLRKRDIEKHLGLEIRI